MLAISQPVSAVVSGRNGDLVADGVDINVDGVRELNEALRKLPFNVARRVATSAIRAQSRPVVKAVRSEIPSRTGALKRAVRLTSVKLDRKSGTVTGTIRAKDTKATKRRSRRQRGAFYGHMVAAGTKPHVIPGPVAIGTTIVENVQHPGAKANPFYDRGLQRSLSQSIQAFRMRFRTKFEQEWLKLYQRPSGLRSITT